MAWFEENYFGPHRWQQFSFFATGSAIASSINESISMSKRWRLEEIRLHFSTAMGSVKYITAQISAGNGSMFNTLIFSEDLNGVIDYRMHYSNPLGFESDDQLVIKSSVLSVANGYGLNVIGWAIID